MSLVSHGTYSRYLAGCLCDPCFNEAVRINKNVAKTLERKKGITPPKNYTRSPDSLRKQAAYQKKRYEKNQ